MTDLTERTLNKMYKSQQHKKKVIEYFQKEHPQLLGDWIKQWKIKDCWNVLKFRKYLNWEKQLYSANACRYDKICIACATRRSILQIQKFEKGIVENWLENMFWYHIIPTIKHNKNQTLKEVMDNLMKAKKRLANDYKNSKRNTQKSKSFFSQFKGMVISTEVSHWKNWYHPHLHILACSEIPLDTEWSNFMKTTSNRELQKERYKYTDWLGLNIWMKSIGVQKNHFNRKGLWEVFKYVVKNAQLELPQLAELLTLQEEEWCKFITTYGICRGWKEKNRANKKVYREEIFIYESNKYGILD